MSVDLNKWFDQEFTNFGLEATPGLGGNAQFIQPTWEWMFALYNSLPNFTEAEAREHANLFFDQPWTPKDPKFGTSHGTDRFWGGTEDQFVGWGFKRWQDDAHTTIEMQQGAIHAQNHLLITGDGWDYVTGGWGDELISTEKGRDAIIAGLGDDVIYAGRDDDYVVGGDGDDRIYGDHELTYSDFQGGPYWAELKEFSKVGFWPGLQVADGPKSGAVYHDYVFPEVRGEGNDVLVGGRGNDVIVAGKGSDLIEGGEGNDVIDPGARGGSDNRDVVSTGAGADVVLLAGGTEQGDDAILDAFAGYSSGVVASEAQDAVKDAIKGAVTEGLKGAIGGALSGVAGGVVGQIAVDAAFGAFDAVLTAIKGVEPTSEDMIYVTDFDPREDLLVLPYTAEDGATFSVRTDLESRSIYDDDEISGPAEPVLKVFLSEDAGAERPLAMIFLSEKFKADISAHTDGVPTNKLLSEVLETVRLDGLNVSGAGLASEETPFDVTPVADLSGLGDIQFRLLGATGPKLASRATESTAEPVVFGTEYNDVLSGRTSIGAVDDTTGTSGSTDQTTLPSTIYAFGGDDLITGSFGRDVVRAGDGDDEIWSMGADDRTPDDIRGEAGDDIVHAAVEENHMIVFGGEGSDLIDFRLTENGVRLFHKDDLNEDGAAAEALTGHDTGGYVDAGDNQYRLVDIETVRASHHGDEIDATGRETAIVLHMHAGDDTAVGGSGNDQIFGNDGHDMLSGGAGDDVLSADWGNDTLDGGRGEDVMFGGRGADTFVFDTEESGLDHILDFQKGEDTIQVEGNRSDVKVQGFGADLALIQNNAGDALIWVEGDGAGQLTVDNFDYV